MAEFENLASAISPAVPIISVPSSKGRLTSMDGGNAAGLAP